MTEQLRNVIIGSLTVAWIALAGAGLIALFEWLPVLAAALVMTTLVVLVREL